MRITVKTTVEFPRERIVSALQNSAASALNRGAASMQTTMRRGLNRVSGWKSVGGGYPGNSKGTLSRSIAIAPAAPLFLEARVGSAIPHAAHMQWGVKKSGKWLTVPVNKQARDALIAAGSVLAIPGLKWRPGKPGTGGVLGMELKSSRGNRRTFIVWFALKAKVDARPWATLAYAEGKGAAIEAIRKGYAMEWGRQKSAIFVDARGGKL